jgi:glycosyltransferase involved in cell wall biosynthesis
MARALIAANSTWNIKNFRVPLIKGLIRAGHQVVTLTPDAEGIDVGGVPVRHRQCAMKRSSIGPLGELAALNRLFWTIRDEHPDIFLGFTIKPNIYGCTVSRLLRISSIPNVSGLGSAFLGSSLLEVIAIAMYRFAFSRSKAVFFQNRDDRALFVERRVVRPEQCTIVPGSGIDLERFAPAELPAANRFVMIARLLGDKGVREYVDAARLVKARVRDARFTLVGQLDEANPSAIGEDELNRWVAEGVIDYRGFTRDVRPLIRESAAVVLPSYREGLPRTLLEAAAMARPLIGTDVPGCREVVREGETGFLCDPRSADSLAAAMTRFIATPHEERVRMGARSRDMAEEEFDQALVVAAYLNSIR